MKPKSLILSNEEVKSIIEGRMSMFALPVNEIPPAKLADIVIATVIESGTRGDEGKVYWHSAAAGGRVSPLFKLPYQPRQIIYLRETWAKTTNVNDMRNGWPNRPHIPGHFYRDMREPLMRDAIIWKADGEWTWCDDDGFTEEAKSHWRPSATMPQSAARIWLRVDEVKCVRVHDLTGTDIFQMGIDNGMSNPTMGRRYQNMQIMEMHSAWQRKYGTGGWETNPWIWLYSFTVLSIKGKPENI